MTTIKAPPHSMEAEQSVLGAIMLDGRNIPEVTEIVGPDDFYLRSHQMIFRAILKCYEKDQPVDAVTVSEEMAMAGTAEEVGGLAYIGTLAKDSPSAANAVAYAGIIRDRAIRRRMILVGRDLEAIGFEYGDVTDSLERARERLMALDQDPDSDGPAMLGDSIMPWLDRLDTRAQNDDPLVGLTTGYEDLDKLTAGMEPADFWLLAARPSMGKSALVLNMLRRWAKAGEPVLMFSLEMSRDQCLQRIAAAAARIDFARLRHATLTEEEWTEITKITAEIRHWPLFVDDTPGLTVAQMQSRARRLQHKAGIKAVVVDHINIARADGNNRTEQMTAISSGMKRIAKSLNVPVLGLGQLNRELEKRPDKRPRLADLRESGSIEQDADVVLFLYRDGYYDEDTQFSRVAEVLVEKQRNGPTGKVLLTYFDHQQRFEDMDTVSQHEYRNAQEKATATLDDEGLGTSRRRRRSA